jgi:hypothetical protein
MKGKNTKRDKKRREKQDASSEFEKKGSEEIVSGKNVNKTTYSCVVQDETKLILLPTAIVNFNCHGIVGKARIMLDSCSQATLISDEFVKKFKLPIRKASLVSTIHGVGCASTKSSVVVDIKILSRDNKFELAIEADMISAEALNYQTNVRFESKIVRALQKLSLADPAYKQENSRVEKIDLLLGAEYFWSCICNESCKIDSLNLQLLKFGWLVSGPAPLVRSANAMKFAGLTLQSVEFDLRKFWEIEEVETVNDSITEHQECVEHFKKTYSIGEDGKFIVRLPFKREKSLVSKNKNSALSALRRAETKLEPKLKLVYNQFMEEYIQTGHMSLAETGENAWFLPHHAVLKPDSKTTPLRVVFNASARERNSISLNDALMVGPNIQRSLFEILIQMRTYKIVFSCDIAKMYRMIWLHEQDRMYQHVWWRNAPNEEARGYQLNTLTYGTAPASYIATQCLNVVADHVEQSNTKLASMIRNNFYMDDLSAVLMMFKKPSNCRKLFIL